MFRNRKLVVKMEKEGKDSTTETYCCDHTFEEKTDTVRRTLESLGAKMFLGVCVYILLDTHRQVRVAEATNRNR